jgi:acyl-CoA thioester hydrolase
MSNWLVTYRRKVRYSDTDAQGIVWNANYAGYFDDALTDLFDDLGLTSSVMQLGGFEVVTAHLSIDFKAAARLGDVLVTRARLGRVGHKSVTFEMETIMESSGTVAVTGSVVFVTVDGATFSSIEVPEAVLDVLEEAVGEPLR